MGKKNKKKGSKKSKSLPVAVMAPLAYVGYEQIVKPIMKKDFNNLAQNLTGFNPSDQTFNGYELLQTYGAPVVGVFVHKGAERIGLNNYVRRVTMGYLSI